MQINNAERLQLKKRDLGQSKNMWLMSQCS